MNATYLVPTQNLEWVKGKLDKLVKAAQKVGCPLAYQHAKTLYWPHPDPKRKAKGELLQLEAVTVEGETPKLAGWAFVATLQHMDGQTILRAVEGEHVPAQYREASPEDCDHCRTRRQRNDTYVVRHEDTGEHKQVGRTCLKDFLGHANPHEVARLALALADLAALFAFEGEEGSGRSEPTVVNLESYLAQTVACIEHDGWTSRTKARDAFPPVEATANWAWHHFCLCASDACKENHRRVLETHHKEAQQVAEWASELEPGDNDYLHNVRVVALVGAVGYRTAGIAASMVAAWRRENERRLYNEKVRADGNAHVGTVGKREELKLTLVSVFETEGYYGTTYIHKFADPDGNAVTWFASNPWIVAAGAGHESRYEGAPTQMVRGATYKVKATVKKHDHYRGQAQTVVTRVAVQPLTKPKRKRKKRA